MAEFREHRFVHESMIEICDMIGEAMAAAMVPTASGSCVAARLSEINEKVWRMRWELDMTGGHPVALAEAAPSGVGIPFGGSEVANG
ncbi:MAG: hypothetical protein ABI548_02865 [Polyangiaceae bacterium]